MHPIIFFLFIVCAIAFVCFFRIVAKQYYFYEIAELSIRGWDERLKIAERKRQFKILFEFLSFLLLWLPRRGLRIIRAILEYGICYCKIPHYYGIVGGKIPKRLYEGDSAQIVLTFPWERPFKNDEEQFGSITYFMHGDNSAYPSLEIELQAAGLNIAGEQTQNRSIRALPAVYTWNILAEKSGNFELGIITRFYSRPDYPPTSVVSIYKIRVTKIAFFTSRQLWIITGLFGILTAMLGIVNTLVSLKIITIP